VNVRNLGIIPKGSVYYEVLAHQEKVQNGEHHEMYSEVNRSTGSVACVCLTCGIQWEDDKEERDEMVM